MDYKTEIKKLAKEKNAIILAHNYQNDEIQDIADITGDSLELARVAANNDAEIIVFCGVHFMAESASILSPTKKVLLPDKDAGCPMADMADKDELVALKKKYPNAKVVTYINSTAEVKAESDVICTSSNAKKIVERIDSDQIIFVPDKNLGNFVKQSSNKDIILWDGYCPSHDRFTIEKLNETKKNHPNVFVMVHPECNKEVVAEADAVFSTGEMVKFAKETDLKEIIVGTEIGMVYKLKTVAPHINFIPSSTDFICPNMKKINLKKLYNSLLYEETVIKVDPSVMEKSNMALKKMLELSY